MTKILINKKLLFKKYVKEQQYYILSTINKKIFRCKNLKKKYVSQRFCSLEILCKIHQSLTVHHAK